MIQNIQTQESSSSEGEEKVTILALNKKVEVSIDPEKYYMLCELGKQENCTPEEMIEFWIDNHPDAHDIQTLDKTVWICSCGLKTKYIEEIREHLDTFPDHTCAKCIEF